MMLRRRSALLGLASAVTLGRASLALAAADTQRRFVVVMLRGALDGMAAVVPYGDPALRTIRGPLVPPEPGRDGGLLDLGGFYGMHPSLTQLHAMFAAGEAIAVHAVAGPYRSRSHFEAQDFMECGAAERMTSGWLNRVAGLLPPARSGQNALAIGASPPLLLRGPAQIGTWAPPALPQPGVDFYNRLMAMHAHDDVTRPALELGLSERGFSVQALAVTPPGPAPHGGLPTLARTAGRLLAAADGPRLAALETADGWDTHIAQAPRLVRALATLDDSLGELKLGLGDAWAKTTVLVMTEFGRTAGVNGTGGTDHGTGTVAFVLGGGIAGGQVRATWPGLGPSQLFEKRDLQPTTDLRELAKGLLVAQFGLDAKALADVFPDSSTASAMGGLLRA